MVFIATALYIEAKPLIECFGLKKDVENQYFQVFKNEEITLVVTGVGKINSSIAVSHAATRYLWDPQSFIINIGVCGSKGMNEKLGNIYLINKIIDNETRKSYIPDILIDHPFEESDIETFNYIVKDKETMMARLCDMEASGFYQAASKFFESHRIYVLKIVSDKVDLENASKDKIYELIKNKIEEIGEFLAILKANFKTEDVFSPHEKEIIDILSEKLKLTASQRQIFYKACLHYKIREGKNINFLEKFFFIKINNKKEREKAFEKILTHLH
ncbi:MAG TPA: 5'-methylthioadenosine/S-adenosylhomocysteine nucleosidase [Clostridia bacterium]|nr:5'-methylthioadenosine/S-adenosylhomocysteine nucleosidase [Clostridia bacterium]